MIKQNTHRKTYSKEFKLQVVKMRIEQGYGYKIITREMGLPDKSLVKNWVKAYEANGEAGLVDRRGKMATGRPRMHSNTTTKKVEDRIKHLEMENEILKKLLELQRRDALLQ